MKSFWFMSLRLWGGGAYLLAQVGDDGQVLAVVPDGGGLLLVPLADLKLQLGIGGLQRAHLYQVGGQAVIEVLHGPFLAACDAETAAAASAACHVKAGANAVGGVGHLDASSSRAAVDTRTPPGACH